MAEAPRDHFDPRHYLRLIWRWKWLLLAVIVVIPTATYFLSKRVDKTYQASTTLLVQATNISASLASSEITVATSSPEQVARLIETPVVGDLAAQELGESSGDGRALLGSVTAEVEDTGAGGADSGFINITTQANDPQVARELARAFARAVAAKRTEDATTALDETIKNISADAESAPSGLAKQNLLAQIDQLEALRPTQAGKTQVVDPAVTPGAPISPKPRRNATLALIFALLLAAGLVPLLDRLDRRTRNPDELEEIVGAPLLAMIPAVAFPGHGSQARVREAFQTLRAGLISFNVDQTLRSVAVTSPAHGEGKTTVAIHLAVALAQDNRNVILVDGDLRRGEAATRLGIAGDLGLDAVLLEGVGVREALVDVSGIKGGRLRVLPAVQPPVNPSVLLGSERMRSVLAELTAEADIVLIDTPPLLVVSDAIPLLDQVSGVVLVARLDQTARDALAKTRQVISTARGKILGVVATGTRGGGLYGYDEYRAVDAGEDGQTVATGSVSTNGAGKVRRKLSRSGKGKAERESG